MTDILPVGSNFTIYIWVDNAVGIEGAQVQFTYDSTSLNATKIVEGPFLQSIGSIVTELGSKRISDILSQISYSAAGVSGDTASGSGVLLNVTFTVVSASSSSFNLVTFIPSSTAGYPGTYFEDINLRNIVPNLQQGFYGSPISFAASRYYITIGDTLTLNGTISGISSANITEMGILYKSLRAGDWATLATHIPVDSSGSFSYQWITNDTGSFVFEAAYSSGNETHTSPYTQVVVEPSLHGYGLYVTYAFVGLIVFIAAISIIFPIRSRRRKAREKPPV